MDRREELGIGQGDYDRRKGFQLWSSVPPDEFAALLEIHGGAARAQTA